MEGHYKTDGGSGEDGSCAVMDRAPLGQGRPDCSLGGAALAWAIKEVPGMENTKMVNWNLFLVIGLAAMATVVT